MRPINLKISAFGPYAGEVEIEFDKFLDRGIYLISGNTGAGKSTIFEAIKFALYGEDNGEARSKYADEDAATYVELTFLLRGNRYKITRNPKYDRPKKSGTGTTTAKADAVLIHPDGRPVSGYSNVTKEIITLTGLNSEQFSKIVMIAQGKFRELLVADTASRSKIFRDIFKTEPYDKIQRRVKNKYLEVYKENSKTNDSIKQYVQGIKINDSYDKKIRLENIINQDIITDIDEVLGLLEEIIVLDEKIYEDNNLILVKKDEEIQKRTNKSTENKKIIENIEVLRIEYNKFLQCEAEKEVIVGEYEKENNLKSVREKMLVELEEEKKVFEKYKQYEELIKKLDIAVRLDESLQQDVVKLEQEKADTQKKIIDVEKSSQLKLEKEKQLLYVQTSVKEKEEYKKKIEKIEQYHKKVLNDEKIYKEKLDIFKEKEACCEMAKNEYNNAFKMFVEAQAGLMAKGLEDNPGSPCPVCGATTYVKLATVVTGAPTEAEVNKLRAKYDAATNDVMIASNEAGMANTAYSNDKTNLSEAIIEVDSSWSIDNYFDNIESILFKTADEINELKKQIEEFDRELKTLKMQLEASDNLKEVLENIQNIIKAKESEINNNKLEIKTIETNLEIIKSQLKTDNEAEARDSLKEKEETYKEMVQSYELAVRRYNEHITKQTKSKTIVKQLAEQMKFINLEEMTEESLSKKKDDLVELVNADECVLVDLENARKDIISINNEVYSCIQNNKEIAARLDEQKRNLGQISRRLSELKILSDTLNGEMEGKDKVKLETFVQISYFEQVIEKANVRLFEMTEGQYDFVRDTSSEDKRTKSGLELSVYDHYNGTIRSVRSLSGGEGFKAALSLALGMADIIEESASGISIDTMFIDEGFGSLDEVALEQVMRVLGRLSEGNKLVGIISHVSTLKERIEKQISVEKRMSGGSSVRVVV